MSSELQLVIAGLRCAIQPPPGLSVVERDPVYAPFMAAGLDADLELTVIPTLEAPPDTSSMPQLFDTEQTWTAHEDGGDVILRLRSQGVDEYLWVARLMFGLEEVVVHCGPRLVEAAGESTTLVNPLHYPLDQLLMIFAMAQRRGLVIHAAGVAREGVGVLCAGRSGAGKTTFMALGGARSRLDGLSDDRVVVREIDGAHRLFGTPWPGEGAVASTGGAELGAITFLHHGDRNELRPLDPAAALQQLLATASLLWFDPERLQPALHFCQELVASVPCFDLVFRREPQAFEVLEELLSDTSAQSPPQPPQRSQ